MTLILDRLPPWPLSWPTSPSIPACRSWVYRPSGRTAWTSGSTVGDRTATCAPPIGAAGSSVSSAGCNPCSRRAPFPSRPFLPKPLEELSRPLQQVLARGFLLQPGGAVGHVGHALAQPGQRRQAQAVRLQLALDPVQLPGQVLAVHA